MKTIVQRLEKAARRAIALDVTAGGLELDAVAEIRRLEAEIASLALPAPAQAEPVASVSGDAEIRDRWHRITRRYARNGSLAKRMALAEADQMEAEGITEADIDRVLAAPPPPAGEAG